MIGALALCLALAADLEDVDARLKEATALAARQEHAAAADAYRALLAAGVDGRDLRYNLGTLSLELEELGDAVLHLRAARRFDPLDDDVRHNLAVALSRRTDRLVGEGAATLTLGERLPPTTARLLFAVPLLLLGAALAARGAWPRRSLGITVVVLSLLSAGGGALWLVRRAFEGTREAVVRVESTAAKKEPAESAATAFEAHAGLLGRVVDEEGSFVRVRLDNGLETWLARDALGLLP